MYIPTSPKKKKKKRRSEHQKGGGKTMRREGMAKAKKRQCRNATRTHEQKREREEV